MPKQLYISSIMHRHRGTVHYTLMRPNAFNVLTPCNARFNHSLNPHARSRLPIVCATAHARYWFALHWIGVWRVINYLFSRCVGFSGRFCVKYVGSNKYASFICESKVSTGSSAWIKVVVPSGLNTSCDSVVDGHVILVISPSYCGSWEDFVLGGGYDDFSIFLVVEVINI